MSITLWFITIGCRRPVWEAALRCHNCKAHDDMIHRDTVGWDSQGREIVSLICTGCGQEMEAQRFEAPARVVA